MGTGTISVTDSLSKKSDSFVHLDIDFRGMKETFCGDLTREQAEELCLALFTALTREDDNDA